MFKTIFFCIFVALVLLIYGAIQQPKYTQDFNEFFGPTATREMVIQKVTDMCTLCEARRKEENSFWLVATAANPWILIQEDPLLKRERVRMMFKGRVEELEKNTVSACDSYRRAVGAAKYRGFSVQ